MNFEDLPLDIRRSILHESRRYGLNKEYIEDIELNKLKNSRCLDEISDIEIKNAVNNGISFLLFDESNYESFIYSISSRIEAFVATNYKIIHNGGTYTIYEQYDTSYTIDTGDETISYRRYPDYYRFKHSYQTEYEFVILTSKSIEEIFLHRGDLLYSENPFSL
jgi:hypothetical protein